MGGDWSAPDESSVEILFNSQWEREFIDDDTLLEVITTRVWSTRTLSLQFERLCWQMGRLDESLQSTRLM